MTQPDPHRPDTADPRVADAVDRAAEFDAAPGLQPDLLSDLPADLQLLDDDLGRLLGASASTAADDDLVRRVFEASRGDLPPRVIPIETSPAWRFRRVAAGIGAVAAAIAVAVVAGRAVDVDRPVDTGREIAAVAADPIDDLDLLEPRDSELMLVAVLDPDEGWFDEDPWGTPLDAEPVLRSRSFGVDELEGTVFAMLGGPTS